MNRKQNFRWTEYNDSVYPDSMLAIYLRAKTGGYIRYSENALLEYIKTDLANESEIPGFIDDYKAYKGWIKHMNAICALDERDKERAKAFYIAVTNMTPIDEIRREDIATVESCMIVV